MLTKSLILVMFLVSCGVESPRRLNDDQDETNQALTAAETDKIIASMNAARTFARYNVSRYTAAHIFSGQDADVLFAQLIGERADSGRTLGWVLYTYKAISLIDSQPDGVVWEYASYWTTNVPRASAHITDLATLARAREGSQDPSSTEAPSGPLSPEKQAALFKLIATDAGLLNAAQAITLQLTDLMASERGANLMRSMKLSSLK